MLHIETHRFSFEQLREEGNMLAGRFTQPQYKTALQFCHQWLNRQETFGFSTSGSTGNPKIIMAPRSLMEASAQATISKLGLGKDEHILVCLNVQFIAGAMMLARGMMLGCALTVTETSTDIIGLLKEDHPYTFVSLVPLQLKNGRHDEIRLNRFRHILVGGSALTPGSEETAAKLATGCYHTYGMTETLSHIALRKIGAQEYFETLPGIAAKLDDRGCLMIRGAVTNDEWLTTNDLAELRDEHHFIILGRADDVINSGGLKFSASGIEAVIRTIFTGNHVNFFITSSFDPLFGEKIIMITEGYTLSETEKETLRQHVSAKISPYAVPRQFLTIAAFRHTPTGKTDKKKTAEQALNTGS